MLLKVDRDGGDKWKSGEFWMNNPENMKNIRYWLYTKAKPYPDKNFIYIDDRYILLVLKSHEFYNYRELVARALDK